MGEKTPAKSSSSVRVAMPGMILTGRLGYTVHRRGREERRGKVNKVG